MSLAGTILRAPIERRSRCEAAYLAATLLPAVAAFALALAAVAAGLTVVVGVGLPLLAGVLALAREPARCSVAPHGQRSAGPGLHRCRRLLAVRSAASP